MFRDVEAHYTKVPIDVDVFQYVYEFCRYLLPVVIVHPGEEVDVAARIGRSEKAASTVVWAL